MGQGTGQADKIVRNLVLIRRLDLHRVRVQTQRTKMCLQADEMASALYEYGYGARGRLRSFGRHYLCDEPCFGFGVGPSQGVDLYFPVN